MSTNLREIPHKTIALFFFVTGLIAGWGFYWLLVDRGMLESAIRRGGDMFLSAEKQIKQGAQQDVPGLISSPEGAQERASVKEGENIFVIVEQPAGNTVVVSMASLAISGWVAVHESGANGELGNILGARRLDAGNYFGESIPLLRDTVEGRIYFAVLHEDNGDAEFDYSNEKPVRDTSGDLVLEKFLAASSGN